MTSFEDAFFQKFKFTKIQIHRYLDGAIRDLAIAKQDKFIEVKFTYSYQALIKIGIAILAKEGGVKVRSVPGHHVKILSKLSDIIGRQDILTIGNAMRMKRNKDLYDADATITQKEADEYIVFIEGVLKEAQRFLK